MVAPGGCVAEGGAGLRSRGGSGDGLQQGGDARSTVSSLGRPGNRWAPGGDNTTTCRRWRAPTALQRLAPPMSYQIALRAPHMARIGSKGRPGCALLCSLAPSAQKPCPSRRTSSTSAGKLEKLRAAVAAIRRPCKRAAARDNDDIVDKCGSDRRVARPGRRLSSGCRRGTAVENAHCDRRRQQANLG